ncbi:hypothetical protein ACFYOT_40115 [Saccharothrix saharensis]|uniref:hypothetical protein n=1 Tax=Saccharothrix saharensis TaxID=571190 RepID=UPI0036CDF354
MTTIDMPDANFNQNRPGGFGPVGRRPDAWPLQAVLNSLCEQPKSGQTWTHVLLANRTGLPSEDVRAAFTATPPLVEWSVYATILRELEADDDDVAVCQRTYRQLAEHLPLRDALPPDIAALTTKALFRNALRSMKGKLTFRKLSDKMRKHDPKHTWERTTLSRYLSTNNTDDPPLPANKDRVRVLLTVLCEHAGRPNDVGHFLTAWERLRSERNRPVRPSIPSPVINRPVRAEETSRTSARTSSSVNATLLVALLLAVVAFIVAVVVLA